VKHWFVVAIEAQHENLLKPVPSSIHGDSDLRATFNTANNLNGHIVYAMRWLGCVDTNRVGQRIIKFFAHRERDRRCVAGATATLRDAKADDEAAGQAPRNIRGSHRPACRLNPTPRFRSAEAA
jgi:hypothetical protein